MHPLPAPHREAGPFLVAGLVILLLWPGLANAKPVLCEAAADRAARATGVPEEVLLAVSITETGRNSDGELRPWPWSINTGGESHWFNSAAELYQAADAALSEGKTNIDLGCFQLNYRWHAEEFTGLDQMIDPQENALYAARFLSRLYDETGDWSLAAAAYHSRTPLYADRYRTRFDEILAKVVNGTRGFAVATFGEQDDQPAENLFPLLRAGQNGVGGSLVPLGQAARPLIGGS